MGTPSWRALPDRWSTNERTQDSILVSEYSERSTPMAWWLRLSERSIRGTLKTASSSTTAWMRLVISKPTTTVDGDHSTMIGKYIQTPSKLRCFNFLAFIVNGISSMERAHGWLYQYVGSVIISNAMGKAAWRYYCMHTFREDPWRICRVGYTRKG